MSAVEISDVAAREATPGEMGPATPAAATPPPDDGTRLSNAQPFPGLRPFGFADRGFFFGRERQAFALYRLVENGRFIAVIGGSGSGKSSLVLAGLQGLLADETADTGGPTWAFLDMRPGGAPITRLAGALAQLSATDSPDETARRRDRIEWTLRQSSFSFESALAEAGGLAGRSLILVVDQFEELFRFGLAGLGYHRGGVEEARRRDEATQFVQILLDADRRRIPNVRVLITMRSDFIGDCANFHCLSEAVSATQYLVPNLTRSQLEEAIRKPVEKAGGTIEPELVERLLNDCGDELDQLPVLQHCLMRLWDRAGAESSAGSSRHLTRATYDAIGRMADALSRHADEIFAQCAGRELAIEQAFRALSEVDREGRAIRRAVRFDKLVVETGVSEADLRAGLDRFRAPNCSFLLPSLSVSPMLGPDERIDIGHEALLRRWKQIAGKPDAVDPTTGRPPPGWLAEEQIDGQRYHTLVSLLDGAAGGERATLDDPRRTKDWWDLLPRTSAWADRYGGRFDEVEKLIDGAIDAKKRSKRNRTLAAALGVVAVLGTAGWIWVAHERAQQRQITQERLRQEELDTSAMTSAKSLLADVLTAYNSKSLDLAGARSLAAISGQFLDNVRQSSKTSAADDLWGESLNEEADLFAILGNNAESLAVATQAKDVARSLMASNSGSKDGPQILYDASIRVGNALWALPGRRQEAKQEYNEAVQVATGIAWSGNATGDADVIDAHLKIGDVYKGGESKPHPQALAEYRSGLQTCEAALAKRPDDIDLLRNEGNAYLRIADLLRDDSTFAEARPYYEKAFAVFSDLVPRDAKQAAAAQKAPDPNLKSNLAASYTHRGLLELRAGNFELALEKLRQGVTLNEELVKNEPGKPQWQDFLTPNYLYLAETLEGLKRLDEALAYYRKLNDARRTLAYRAPGQTKPQKDFAEAAKLLGDRSTGLAQIEAYREAVRIWNRLVEDSSKAEAAADQYDVVLGFARAFDAKKDWPDAQSAYRTAMKIAVLNYVKDPSATSWRDKAEEAERAAVVAGKASETAPADGTR
jgi:tetratricopeptide (TPR) repeat protein/energy-coupling factor transporter ATP-binding protein EcfA2